MTKKLRTELGYEITDLARDLKLHENIVHALDQRVDGVVARIEWMQIEQARALEQLRTANFVPEPSPPPPTPRPLLNGSWPQRDGNTYPQYDTTRHEGPLGGYESYVRRSPPAIDASTEEGPSGKATGTDQ